MSLLGNAGRIAIWDMHTVANYRQVWRKSCKVLFYREKGGSYEQKFVGGDRGGGGFSLAEMLLGEEKIFLFPAGVVE